MSRLLPERPDVGRMDRARRRRPIPPVDHGAGLEARPEPRLPLDQDHAVASDLETQQGRRSIDVDDVDLAAHRSSSRGADLPACFGRSGLEAQRKVDIAPWGAAATRRGAEQDNQLNGRVSHERVPESFQVHGRHRSTSPKDEPRERLRRQRVVKDFDLGMRGIIRIVQGMLLAAGREDLAKH